MKTVVAALILLWLFVSSANAQGQQSPREKLHRDFPNVQVIRPSLPPSRFNFESKRWERDYGLTQLEVVPAARTNIDLFDLRLLPKQKARILRRKRTRHHIHRPPAGR